MHPLPFPLWPVAFLQISWYKGVVRYSSMQAGILISCQVTLTALLGRACGWLSCRLDNCCSSVSPLEVLWHCCLPAQTPDTFPGCSRSAAEFLTSVCSRSNSTLNWLFMHHNCTTTACLFFKCFWSFWLPWWGYQRNVRRKWKPEGPVYHKRNMGFGDTANKCLFFERGSYSV